MGVTSIRLSEDVEVPLEQLAKKLDRSKNYLVNQAVKEEGLAQAFQISYRHFAAQFLLSPGKIDAIHDGP